MRTTVVILVLMLGAASTGAGQEVVWPAPLTLSADSSKTYPLRSFLISGNVQCDAAGNLYSHSAKTENESVLLKVRTDGSYTIYTLSSQDAAETYFLAFRVNPDGRLWILNHGKKSGLYLFSFDQDPNMPSKTRLDAPDGLEAQNFIVMKNGNIVLQGFFADTAPAKYAARNYFAVFNSSGDVIRNSVDEKLPSKELKEMLLLAADAAAAQAEDGMTYLLQGNNILVLSQAGELVNTFRLTPPQPGFRPFNMYVAGGRLAVAFLKTPEKFPAKISPVYGLLNRHTAQPLRLFEPSPETGNSLVCFTEDGFKFIRFDKDGMKLITARSD